MKIMIIEDDLTIAKELGKVFEKWQFEVVIVEEFEYIIEAFREEQPQLILLDVNLPYYNGYYWCREIRKESDIPIIFISSVSDRMDMIMAMQMGADDYIPKPIDMQFMVSKVQALLRRTYDFSMQAGNMEFAGVLLDIPKSKVIYQGGQADLTFTELQIMTTLFQHKGEYVSREAILDDCWQNNQFIDDNTLAVNMTRIRKKLKSIGLDNFIETKKNYGYRLKGEGDSV
ncbi:response regulator transcription factor [Facklamia tabacinasalis]|uniref:Response regulator transcription factor n=2 Tax=Ruoffia tabacinasalis TaxID=87458 RepID=A0ABS0LGB1_9LACT|nr:response regulator transcription factor [Ruoffia tabacinasalis]